MKALLFDTLKQNYEAISTFKAKQVERNLHDMLCSWNRYTQKKLLNEDKKEAQLEKVVVRKF